MLGTKERTVTPADVRADADAKRRAANKAAGAARDAVDSAWRSAQGEDRFEKLKAEADLPRLRVALAQAEAEAERAKAEYDRADAAWREERAAHYRPLFAAGVKALDAALEEARKKNDELLALAMRARAEGVPFWYELTWPELTTESRTRQTRLDAWRACLKRNDWL